MRIVGIAHHGPANLRDSIQTSGPDKIYYLRSDGSVTKPDGDDQARSGKHTPPRDAGVSMI